MKYIPIAIILLLPALAHAQVISTFTGTGVSGISGDGGPANLAKIVNPDDGTFDAAGNYYFSDFLANKIRKITPAGVISTVVGDGSPGFFGDGGPATAAKIKNPTGVACDTANNLYFADHSNYRIRKVDHITGIITTVAGAGTLGDSGDGGPATLATFFPAGVHFDKKGNLYISDNYYHKIRKISTSGSISTIAGIGSPGFSGDSGPAILASLNYPNSMTFDDTGNLYVADVNNARIRKIDTFGIINTIAGTGATSFNGDGIPAITAQIGGIAICFDNGKLIVTDPNNNRIRVISPTGIITTIAGTGVPGYNGDAIAAISAQVYSPGAPAADACHNIYFADINNYRIRKITFDPVTSSTINITAVTAAPLGSTVTVNAAVSGAGSTYNIKWFNKGVQFATTTVPTVTYTKTQDIDSITARLVPSVVYCYDSSVSGLQVITKSPGGITAAATVGPVLIYPNPATDIIYISGNSPADIVVSDMVGRQFAAHKHTSGTSSISITSLPAAVYTVRIIQDGHETTQKLIKQ